MNHWRPMLGIACGLLLWAGLAVSGLFEKRAPAAAVAGAILPECDGALRQLVIQYVAGSDFALATYASFLPQLPAGVSVYAVCPDQAAFDQLARSLPRLACELRPIITGHPLTTWSRDRWIAVSDGRREVLICPREEASAAAWPERAGDQQVAFTLSHAISDGLVASRSELAFDGGDLMADSRCVFVTPAVLRRNLQQTVQKPEELLPLLGQMTKRRVVLLDPAPDHHAGMFMMAAGDGVMLVGDPALARPLWDRQPLARESNPAWRPDFSASTQSLFDAVARQAAEAGYRVVRIPVVPGEDARAYLTWVNGIIDQREGQRHVYMPSYRGVEPLNAAAEAIWRELGYQVHRVDCTEVFPHFGTLHCLVNVARRG